MREDRGLNILQYKKQTGLINSLFYATANVYRESTERFWKKFIGESVFSRNFNETPFLMFSDNFRLFQNCFLALPKLFGKFNASLHKILFSVYFRFHQVFFRALNQLNYSNLVASLRMGIYEEQQINTKTSSPPIRFQNSLSGPHTNRMEYDKKHLTTN